VLTDLDLSSLIRTHQQEVIGPHLTMSLYRVPNPRDCGIVDLDASGRVRRFVEKPEANAVFSDLASAGVMVFDASLMDYIPDGRPFDIGHDLIPRLLADGVPIYGWVLPSEAYLIDIGSPVTYARVQQEWPTPAAATFAHLLPAHFDATDPDGDCRSFAPESAGTET
jgi:NDP-sugar pyrophosphorylase family protein